MYFIDAHCHLDLLPNISIDPEVEDIQPIKTITVTNAPFLFEPNQRLFKESKNIRVALGLHPELIQQYHNQIEKFKELISSTRYVGEIGLDGSLRFKSSYSLQQIIFKELLECVAAEKNKIVTIHSRNASIESIDILAKYLKFSNCKVILHWYTGGISELKVALNSGFFFSVNHKMISTKKGSEIIREIPINRIITETDAPFTFDHAIKDRMTSLVKTVEGLASIKNMNIEEVKETVYQNFKTILM